MPGFLMAQSQTGMHFEHGLSWAQILAKAKAENKHIFMDAFTTWCGPCKMMARDIFPQEEVGKFFNASYLNVKVQLDTTKNDNEEVKSWYADGHKIMKDYKVNVFPTYLFFAPDGKLVHRAVGASDAAAFIAKGKDALDPTKQYYTLVRRYDAGEKSPEFLRNLAKTAQGAYDMDNTGKFAQAYLATQTDLFTKDNIEFLRDFTQKSSDPGFELMRRNPEKFDAVLGPGKSAAIVKNIVLSEDVYPVLFSRTQKDVDWPALKAGLTKKYGSLGNEAYDYAHIIYLQQKGNWPEFSKEVSAYISKYNPNFGPSELNSFAWTIFEACEDANCIAMALTWSKTSVDLTQNPMFIDTYANLLHKTGKTQEAIEWQTKAIALLKQKGESTEEYEGTLDKMKKGEKTWE
jgi:thioredoxin-related protein